MSLMLPNYFSVQNKIMVFKVLFTNIDHCTSRRPFISQGNTHDRVPYKTNRVYLVNHLARGPRG